nr:putative integron gene cassette protein [uncultured bacterium]
MERLVRPTTTAIMSPVCISNSYRPEPLSAASKTDTDPPQGQVAGITSSLTSLNVIVKGSINCGEPLKSKLHMRVAHSKRIATIVASWSWSRVGVISVGPNA